MGDCKGVNLPGCPVDLPALTEKDRKDIAFGLLNRIDCIAASFVRSSSDIAEVKECVERVLQKIFQATDVSALIASFGLDPMPFDLHHVKKYYGEGLRPAIIAKIENQQGLDNFTAILEASDGIMVARGDLGVEIPVEEVFRWQKAMIRACNRAGKPVITATQMLESMVTMPRPTRAEATDVANAVLDGSDGVMLSGETAKGVYPVRAVDVMARICRVAEGVIDYERTWADLRRHTALPSGVHEAIAASAVKASWDVQATCIIALTQSGRMARTFSRHRPIPPVLALTCSHGVATQMQLLRGIYPLIVPSMHGTEDLIRYALRMAISDGICAPGDPIVCTAGQVEGHSGSTNTVRILTCPPLESLPSEHALRTFFAGPVSRRDSVALVLD